jgi:hypothetical protein
MVAANRGVTVIDYLALEIPPTLDATSSKLVYKAGLIGRVAVMPLKDLEETPATVAPDYPVPNRVNPPRLWAGICIVRGI